jgi:hypothetical protein
MSGLLTPQQTELALSGAAAALGLVPTTAKVLAAQEAGPSSAPGGTWDITVRVTDPNGGPDWDAVTRMSFSSPERREQRTTAGVECPSWWTRKTNSCQSLAASNSMDEVRLSTPNDVISGLGERSL